MIPGDAIALLRIPAFGSDYEVPILSGTDLSFLNRGVGHYTSRLSPEQIGNFAIAGHRVTHGQPFARLLELDAGDQIIVETRDAIYTYVMDGSPRNLTVNDTETWVLDPDPQQPGAQATRGADDADDLPGPVPLTGPLGRVRPSREDGREALARVWSSPAPHLPERLAYAGLTVSTLINRTRSDSDGGSGQEVRRRRRSQPRLRPTADRVLRRGLFIGSLSVVLAAYLAARRRRQDLPRDSVIGLWVMTGVIGLVTAAAVLVLHRRPWYAPWVLLGLLPMLVSAYWIL